MDQIINNEKKDSGVIFAGEKDEFDIDWCRWASEERVICGIRRFNSEQGDNFVVTRLVGVNADGVQYLIEEGAADPNRICVAGWDIGGYLALIRCP